MSVPNHTAFFACIPPCYAVIFSLGFITWVAQTTKTLPHKYYAHKDLPHKHFNDYVMINFVDNSQRYSFIHFSSFQLPSSVIGKKEIAMIYRWLCTYICGVPFYVQEGATPLMAAIDVKSFPLVKLFVDRYKCQVNVCTSDQVSSNILL